MTDSLHVWNEYVHLLFVLVAISFFASCQDKRQGLPERALVASTCINELSDSSYLLSIEHIELDDKRLYLCDLKRSQILILEKDLNLISTFGSYGRGPKEFIDANFFSLQNDTLFVKDPGNNRIQRYLTNGEYAGCIKFNYNPLNLITGFLYDSSKLLGSSFGEKAIIRYTIDNQEIKNEDLQFGERFEFGSEIKNRIRNNRFILKHNSLYITISDNIPCIECFNLDGNNTAKYDFSEIPIIAKQLQYIASLNLPERSYGTLVDDCCISNNQLYLLINRNSDFFTCNTLLRFEIEPEIKAVEVLYLPDAIYNCFSVDHNRIYAYGDSGLQIINYE